LSMKISGGAHGKTSLTRAPAEVGLA